VTQARAEAFGRASNALGAGRSKVDDPVDHPVGVVLSVKPGDAVAEGDSLVEIHHRDGLGLESAIALCRGAIQIGDAPPPPRAKVLAEIR
jgi:thymidine phosphorylase